LTILENKNSKNMQKSIDSRTLVMLQKQKELLKEPEDVRKPTHTSKIKIQGRIEMLEWLLMDEQK